MLISIHHYFNSLRDYVISCIHAEHSNFPHDDVSADDLYHSAHTDQYSKEGSLSQNREERLHTLGRQQRKHQTGEQPFMAESYT